MRYGSEQGRSVLSLLVVMGVAVTLAAVYLLVASLIGLPTNAEIVDVSREWYAEYGYLAAFVAALCEGLVVVGWYAPGSVVIVLGAAFSADGTISLWWFLISAILGFCCAHTINYAVGRFGWLRLLERFGTTPRVRSMLRRWERDGKPRPLFIILCFFSPNVGGLCSTIAGVMGFRFREFLPLMIIGTVAWSTLWAIAAYYASDLVLAVLSSWLIVPLIVISVLVILGDGPSYRRAVTTLASRALQRRR